MSDNTNRDNKNPRFGSKPPSGGDDPNQPKKGPRFSIYWIYAIIFAVLIGFQLFGPFSPTMAKTSSMEFRNMLANGEVVAGTNQENASYPVGICAERVLLGNAATLYPGIAIETTAISYNSDNVKSDHPISPCGMCRQALLEYETRLKYPIRLILAGMEGEIQIVKTSSLLLPFAFTSSELK